MQACKMDDKIESCFEARNAMKRESFYTDAADYWSKIPRTVDGMLGGYGNISGVDIEGSLNFLKPFLTVSLCASFDWCCVLL